MKSPYHKISPINDMDMPHASGPVYPMVYFKETDLPEIKDYKVGEDYELKLKITLKSLRELSAGELEAGFEMKEVGVEK